MRRRHTAEPTLKLRNNVFSSRDFEQEPNRGGSLPGRISSHRRALRAKVSLSWLIPDLALLPQRTWSALPAHREAPTAEAVFPTLNPKPHPWFPQTGSPKSTEYRREYHRDPFHYLWAGAPCGSPGDAPQALSLCRRRWAKLCLAG